MNIAASNGSFLGKPKGPENQNMLCFVFVCFRQEIVYPSTVGLDDAGIKYQTPEYTRLKRGTAADTVNQSGVRDTETKTGP